MTQARQSNSLVPNKKYRGAEEKIYRKGLFINNREGQKVKNYSKNRSNYVKNWSYYVKNLSNYVENWSNCVKNWSNYVKNWSNYVKKWSKIRQKCYKIVSTWFIIVPKVIWMLMLYTCQVNTKISVTDGRKSRQWHSKIIMNILRMAFCFSTGKPALKLGPSCPFVSIK